MPKVFFPNIPFRLIKAESGATNKAIFHVPPKLNKWDIKNYLQQVYQLKVLDVHTRNVEGKTKMLRSRGGYYKRPSFKKAFVTLAETFKFPEMVTPPPTVNETKGPSMTESAASKS